MLKSVCLCECGLIRTVNQDRAEGFSAGQTGLYLVADGMGGHYAGEKASEAIRVAFAAWWQKYMAMPQRPRFLQVLEQLQELIGTCNAEIRRQTPAGQRSGSTLVLLWIDDGDYAVLSVGDSRCYRAEPGWFGAKVEQLTCDDIVNGSSEWEKKNRGKLRHAVGSSEDCPVTVRTGHAKADTVFLLCSDGVYKPCAPGLLVNQLRRSCREKDLPQAAARLEHAVVQGGAPDNYSLILVQI